MDLRNGYMIPPYGERYNYVNCAVAIHSIQVPCNLFKNEGKSDDFWKAATFISNQWAIIKKKKGMAKTAEADAKARVDFLKKIRLVNPSILGEVVLTLIVVPPQKSSSPNPGLVLILYLIRQVRSN